MLIDITDFYYREDPSSFAASVSELGNDAGAVTWMAAMRAAEEYNLLDTEDKRDAARKYMRSTGGWTGDCIASWSNQHLTALLIQFIAGDMREGNLYGVPEDDWLSYYRAGSDGEIHCCIERHDDVGRIYFVLEN